MECGGAAVCPVPYNWWAAGLNLPQTIA